MPKTAFFSTLIMVSSVLALSLIPILVSKKKYLRQRWFSWLAISAVYSLALFADRFQTAQGWPAHSATGLVWLIVAITLQVEVNRLASHHENRSLVFLMLFTLLVWVACISLWMLDWAGFVLFFLVAAFDVAGWVGGQVSRKLRLRVFTLPISPKTSPNKTVGGLALGAVVVGFMLLALGYPHMGLWLAIVILAAAGDWLESAFKRKIGVKDAGTWLPGFGGFLDRFDSILLLAPVALLAGLLGQ